jgi:uncharacterized protein YcbK (DUF882 family)
MKFSDESIQWLEKLRLAVRRPVRINSGYRCPEHNDAVSKSGLNGPHTVTANDNVAVDIGVSGTEAYIVLREACKLDFTGLGIAQKGGYSGRIIHLDRIRPGDRIPRPGVWSY